MLRRLSGTQVPTTSNARRRHVHMGSERPPLNPPLRPKHARPPPPCCFCRPSLCWQEPLPLLAEAAASLKDQISRQEFSAADMQGQLSERTRLRDALAAAGETKLKARKGCVCVCVSLSLPCVSHVVSTFVCLCAFTGVQDILYWHATRPDVWTEPSRDCAADDVLTFQPVVWA